MDTLDTYILKGKKAYRVGNPLIWAKWSGTAPLGKQIVKQETLANGLWVSTVFLGIDLAMFPGEKRQLFETMVFIPRKAGERFCDSLDMDRYSTWGEAEKGHKKIVEKYNSYIIPQK